MTRPCPFWVWVSSKLPIKRPFFVKLKFFNFLTGSVPYPSLQSILSYFPRSSLTWPLRRALWTTRKCVPKTLISAVEIVTWYSNKTPRYIPYAIKLISNYHFSRTIFCSTKMIVDDRKYPDRWVDRWVPMRCNSRYEFLTLWESFICYRVSLIIINRILNVTLNLVSIYGP